MRTIKFLLKKEFIQIFRNRTMLPLIFVMPILQLVILVHAATFDIKNINLLIVDKDLSSVSRELCSKFEASPFFNVTDYSFSVEEARESMVGDECLVILHIPENFEQQLIRENEADLQLLINAIDGSVAGIAQGYIVSIISSYNKNILFDWYKVADDTPLMEQVNIEYSYWYNPDLNYKTYMVPGILVLLVTIIAMFLSAMNLVREKEIGTIEQINVTPIKRHQFIIGKLLPFWVISMFEMAFGLVLGKLMFDIPIVGSLWLIFLSTSVYLLVILGMGLFVSTITQTQQQAMFISWFFLLVFILMSGLFTSIDSMPEWAQKVNVINPIAYFIKLIRMILLKGSELMHILRELVILLVYGVLMLALAMLKYRKVS